MKSSSISTTSLPVVNAAGGNAGACGGTVIPAMIGVDGLTYVGGQETGHGPYTEFEGGWGFCVITRDAYEAFEPEISVGM